MSHLACLAGLAGLMWFKGSFIYNSYFRYGTQGLDS